MLISDNVTDLSRQRFQFYVQFPLKELFVCLTKTGTLKMSVLFLDLRRKCLWVYLNLSDVIVY